MLGVPPLAKSAIHFTTRKLGLAATLKRWSELRFWRALHAQINGDPARAAHERAHYRFFYTTFFGLALDDYRGRRVLDIGCGPLGSLEWASNAAERVGLDPLADDYADLGTADHAMQYVAAPSERIPFPDSHFDIAAAFNSLDHVDDVSRSIAEMKRVTAPAGRILLIVEIDHPPTPAEPHCLRESVLEKFSPFRPVMVQRFGVRADHQLYQSITDATPYVRGAPGLLCARLECGV